MKIMIFTVTLIIPALLLTAVAFGASPQNVAEINKKAPDFKLRDSNGDEHSLSDYKGDYVVLEWINFDCPFVRKHYNSGNMQKLQKEYTGKGVIWLSVCSSAPGKQGSYTNDEINEKISKLKADMTAYLVDKNGAVGRMYDATRTPQMYIINPEGILVYAGAIDDKPSTDTDDIAGAFNYVRSALDSLLAGKQITTKVTVPYGCSVKY